MWETGAIFVKLPEIEIVLSKMNLENANIPLFSVTVIYHTKSSYKIIIYFIFYLKFVNIEPLNKGKILKFVRREYIGKLV